MQHGSSGSRRRLGIRLDCAITNSPCLIATDDVDVLVPRQSRATKMRPHGCLCACEMPRFREQPSSVKMGGACFIDSPTCKIRLRQIFLCIQIYIYIYIINLILLLYFLCVVTFIAFMLLWGHTSAFVLYLLSALKNCVLCAGGNSCYLMSHAYDKRQQVA